MLEIVGVTSTDLIFYVTFVYMEVEGVENYSWPMEKFLEV